MRKSEIKKQLKGMVGSMELVEEYYGEEKKYSEYLGSFMSLDPCGRYHHIFSPNGATSKCERFWNNLEECAGELGGWIEGGEGDPTDIFFCMPYNETE